MLASRRGTAVYLLFYAANAAVLPVLTLYYESLGVDGARLGLLAAIWPAGSMVGASVWGAIADSSGRHRFVLRIAIVSTIGTAQLFLLGSGFATLVPIVAIFALSLAPVSPMLDHAVVTDLGSRHHLFGRVRLWGAVGWGVSAPLLGMLVDATSLRIVFPAYAVLMGGLLAATLTLPVPGSRLGRGVFAGLGSMVRDRRWRFFLLTVFIAGTGSTMIHHYLFVYLNAIGGSGTMRGIALAVATVSELVVLGFADRLLRRFGPQRLILAALAAVGVRMLGYGFINNPVLALVPQLLHGTSFAMLLVAGVAMARELAPDGMGATAQAVYSATHMGAAGIVGALLGGVLYRSLGPNGLFLASGTAALGLLVALVAGVQLTGRLRATSSRNGGYGSHENSP